MLSYDEVYQTYLKIARRDGRATCSAVADDLFARGIKPLGYDQPYSRQRIRCILSTNPEGRSLIQHKVKSRAVIVEDRQGVIEWLKEHNLQDIEVISPDKVSPADVKGAYVYGDLPVSLAKIARSVWLVTTPQGMPIVADIPVTELNNVKAELREIKIKVVQ